MEFLLIVTPSLKKVQLVEVEVAWMEGCQADVLLGIFLLHPLELESHI